MAHHRGPKTITQDLVFHYDTGNEKSFVGEPTSNVYTLLGSSGFGSAWIIWLISPYKVEPDLLGWVTVKLLVVIQYPQTMLCTNII